MKKLIFGASALLLISSIISCRDAETTTAEAEGNVEQIELQEGNEPAVKADSLEIIEEVQTDSVPVSKTEGQ